MQAFKLSRIDIQREEKCLFLTMLTYFYIVLTSYNLSLSC